MSEWRPEQLETEKLARSQRSIFPMGLEGTSANPTPTVQDLSVAQATIRGTPDNRDSGVIMFAYDFTVVAGTSGTTLALKFIPIPNSMHVYLNGLEQYENTDWTYNDAINCIVTTGTMEEQADDFLECRYAHRGDALIDLLVDTFTRSDTTIGDLGIADSGQPWLNGDPLAGVHAMQVVGNKCVGGNGAPALAESGLLTANGVYESDLTLQASGSPSAAIGCMAAIGDDARWQFSAHMPGGRWILSYWPAGGVETTADQNLTGPAVSTLYRMKIVVLNGNVKCYANGDLKIDHTMSGPLWTYFENRTAMLLRSSNTGNEFDNVEVSR